MSQQNARGETGLAIAPAQGLAHVFYSDSGSTAVEVALKMALGYWRNIGEPRTRIVALEHAYHGDTIGTMSAGARGVFNAAYEPLLFDVTRLPFPVAGREQATLDAFDACRVTLTARSPHRRTAHLRRRRHADLRADVLTEMQRICTRHGVLLIADEVMTGWGRTGTLLCLRTRRHRSRHPVPRQGADRRRLPARRHTGDCKPSSTRTIPPIARKRFFTHPRSTANPIGCAAASANLDIWADEPVAEAIATLQRNQSSRLAAFAQDPRFANVRQLGTIAALDLRVPDAGYLADIGPTLYSASHGSQPSVARSVTRSISCLRTARRQPNSTSPMPELMRQPNALKQAEA